jgi:hypothetical protein
MILSNSTEGNYLHGVECGLCAKGFVTDGSSGTDSSSGFRPSSENPIYCCVDFKGRNGGVEKCRHAISCASCWRECIRSSPVPTRPVDVSRHPVGEMGNTVIVNQQKKG